MKTKKIISIVLILCFVLLFSGCDIKFIEKIETEDTTVAVDLPTDNKNTDEPHQEETTSEVKETTAPITLPPDKTTEVDGVSFVIENMTVYVKNDTVLYDSPSSKKTELGKVEKGDVLVSYGVSTDQMFNMVRFNGGDFCYILAKNVSYGYIAKETEPIETEPPETEPPETEKPTKKPSSGNSSNSQSSNNTPIVTNPPPVVTQRPTRRPTQKPTQRPTRKPTTIQGGIPYPAHPSSTSVNFGVTFADVNIKVKVIKTAKLNSGPAKALNSNGYKTLQTFNTGTILQCTGIGANGWIRIKLANGTIGYIDGSYLIKA